MSSLDNITQVEIHKYWKINDVLKRAGLTLRVTDNNCHLVGDISALIFTVLLDRIEYLEKRCVLTVDRSEGI